MALPGTAAAQGFSGLTGSGGGALEIQAEDGIAWRRQEQVYVARGNAVAKRGDLTVRAETLTAHYREAEGGGDTEIYRIVAEGDVELVTPRETATGDRGVYDLDKAVMVLTGRDLRLVTGTEEVTAEDSLEYWEDRNLAVARGNAVARNEMAGGGTRRVSANILTAYFQDAAAPDDAAADDGNGAARADLDRIEAFENVQIASPNTFARGDKAVYVTRMQTATLVGDVRISRGENQLNGGYAEVNLETGVSRLLGAPPDSDARARVRGLLKPRADGLNGAPAQ
jgi:lipopolysaccharide export system protein LptA